MLKVEKKIQSEINRLEQMLYRHRTPVKGWMAKQGYYRHPEEYEMMDGEWEELAEGIHVGSPDRPYFSKTILYWTPVIKARPQCSCLRLEARAAFLSMETIIMDWTLTGI